MVDTGRWFVYQAFDQGTVRERDRERDDVPSTGPALAGGAIGISLQAACASAASNNSPPATPTPPSSTPVSNTNGVVSTPPPAAALTAPTAQPVSGGTLQIGTITDITQLEAHRLQGQNWNMLYPIFDRLAEYDDKLVPQPRLAQSWEFSTDNKSLELHLRQGVQFHSGRELTSDDIKYNILRPAAFDFLEYLNIIDSVTAEGPNAATTLVGTGPFKFTEWATGDHLTFAKNPQYWQSGVPYLNQAVFHIGRDQQALITQLEAGAIDAMDTPPVTDAVPARDGHRLYAHGQPGGQTCASRTYGISSWAPTNGAKRTIGRPRS